MCAPDTDQILMQRLQAGDEHVFEVLVHKYQGLVLSLCRRYLGSRASQVDDVAQEVFVRVFKGRMGYEPRAKVKTWIYAIAVNACLNEIRRLRSAKRRAVASFTAVFGDTDVAGEHPAFEAPGRQPPGAELDADEAGRRVRAAVDALPEQQRLALILARYHHCSYDDIATTMDTSVSAVKSLLTRARGRLKEDLRDLVEGERFKQPVPLDSGALRPAQRGSSEGHDA